VGEYLHENRFVRRNAVPCGIGSRSLGYLFADTDNAYRIRQVGFGALRRRRSIFWPSQELIDLLASPGVATAFDCSRSRAIPGDTVGFGWV